MTLFGWSIFNFDLFSFNLFSFSVLQGNGEQSDAKSISTDDSNTRPAVVERSNPPPFVESSSSLADSSNSEAPNGYAFQVRPTQRWHHYTTVDNVSGNKPTTNQATTDADKEWRKKMREGDVGFLVQRAVAVGLEIGRENQGRMLGSDGWPTLQKWNQRVRGLEEKRRLEEIKSISKKYSDREERLREKD